MFTRNDLIGLLRATPFTPFRLHLSDGGTVVVVSREFALAGRRFAVVGIPDSEDLGEGWDHYVRVYYASVTRSEILRGWQEDTR